jgi:hypothetical protein
VTRAVEAAIGWFRHDAAGQVCALPAVGSKALLIEPHQHALVVYLRVGEGQSTPDRNIVYAPNELNRRFASTSAKKVLDNDPELPDCEGKARKHQEFGEVTPSDVMVFWPVDRKIVTPLRLLEIGTTIGRDSYLFAVGLTHRTSLLELMAKRKP